MTVEELKAEYLALGHTPALTSEDRGSCLRWLYLSEMRRMVGESREAPTRSSVWWGLSDRWIVMTRSPRLTRADPREPPHAAPQCRSPKPRPSPRPSWPRVPPSPR